MRSRSFNGLLAAVICLSLAGFVTACEKKEKQEYTGDGNHLMKPQGLSFGVPVPSDGFNNDISMADGNRYGEVKKSFTFGIEQEPTLLSIGTTQYTTGNCYDSDRDGVAVTFQVADMNNKIVGDVTPLGEENSELNAVELMAGQYQLIVTAANNQLCTDVNIKFNVQTSVKGPLNFITKKAMGFRCRGNNARYKVDTVPLTVKRTDPDNKILMNHHTFCGLAISSFRTKLVSN